jgi:hypothetical protein
MMTLWFLFSHKMRTSTLWRATITPLASIIGSGFLISAPLLALVAGPYAAFVMLVIVMVGYILGSSLRFNILHTESLHNRNLASGSILRLSSVSRFVLGIAYIISVAFYLKLLSAFLLDAIGYRLPLYENSLTTLILIFIGFMGKIRGLSILESFEIYCVNSKLAIIVGLLVGYAFFNGTLIWEHTYQTLSMPSESLWLGFRKLLGIIIIIQGFEISRYLGAAYDPKTRALSMKYAQIISGIIYVVFITLATTVIGNISTVNETVIISMSQVVAPILPFLLLIAAMMSQFSAAVADTVGGGGLLIETFSKRLSINNAYILTTIFTCVLTWTTNIFDIIVIASKAFALYYVLQTIITLIAIHHLKHIKHKPLKTLLYSGLLILMGMAVFLSIPAE